MAQSKDGDRLKPPELTKWRNGTLTAAYFYYSDKFKNEPWYEMEVNGFTLVIGPRKRVVSITLSRDEPFPVTSLRELGERDGVTYTADGGWKSDLKEATSANLHAWGKKKSIEYVKAMLEIVKS